MRRDDLWEQYYEEIRPHQERLNTVRDALHNQSDVPEAAWDALYALYDSAIDAAYLRHLEKCAKQHEEEQCTRP